MRLLVTGGSGFLGGYVLDEAARRGHEAVALARSEAELFHHGFVSPEHVLLGILKELVEYFHQVLHVLIEPCDGLKVFELYFLAYERELLRIQAFKIITGKKWNISRFEIMPYFLELVLLRELVELRYNYSLLII